MDFCSKILTAGLIGFYPCSGSVVDCKKEELKCAKHDVIHKVRCYLKCMQKVCGYRDFCSLYLRAELLPSSSLVSLH